MKAIDKLKVFANKFYEAPLIRLYWNHDEYFELAKSIITNKVVDGNEIKELENFFADQFGFREVFGTNYARTAIECALENLPAEARNEVIVPSFGCTGTIQPILEAGLKPVFCDIDQDFNLSPTALQGVITNKTKAVVVPGLYGKPAQWNAIRSICKEKELFVIDDAAQTLGCPNAGKNGDAGIFSFSLGKIISSTGGGLLCYQKNQSSVKLEKETYNSVFLRSAEVVLRAGLRKYTLPFFSAQYLIAKRIWPNKYTYKASRISNLDAAIALKQLPKLKEIIRLKRRNAKILIDELEKISQIILPPYSPDHVYTKFTISLTGQKDEPKPPLRGAATTAFVRFMATKGIECEWCYIPLHYRPPYNAFNEHKLPKTESSWGKCISIPCEPSMSEEETKNVATQIKEFFKK